MICLGPGWQMEKRDTSICSSGSSWETTGLWSCNVQACQLWQSSLSGDPYSPSATAVCVRVPAQTRIDLFISLLLPGETLTLGHLFLLLVDITKLSVLPGGPLTFTQS